ncbi:3-hydroxy-D-aspartate aldolase [Variibacter gotjawalensis]|uniref:3-hydroxy-D-aspartate aldolase n=1 Tax=Variibacter gotjawalensis TaxID=1333996 RepID=A0A0S3PRE8_9BRAD|nr:DSD1 family PLP-dependent enzyme [Variibacter gotjawalensis]NIK48823.1 3-hydroxy-D-aspartate aldolase [Variibacter gotjawalensis]RZS50683.1 D-3-hydroxyaspartate aldolase [Variibacter gotjawalensis]BAT58517.1 3-hydroxy-D-aspartate aldolase [Variibacter gotjawalensis]
MTAPRPASVGMSIDEVDTPCLLVDLDAFERNVATVARFVAETGVRLRAHAKTHKSADIAAYQIEKGGAVGVCCQKVSEAEALVDGGIRDVLVSNQVVAPLKIDRLAALAKRARIIVCVDDAANVADLSAAAAKHGATIECLVEIDVGQDRCGVEPGADAVALAQKIAASPDLKFAGLQAYHGRAQHIRDYALRKAHIDFAIAATKQTLSQLYHAGIECGIVAGAGTGTFRFEGASGIYNELQCGSYVFMDADYQRVKGANGEGISDFDNALFVLTSVMSKTRPGKAVCDAGLKAQSVDSGMPVVFGRDDLRYVKCSDEHGVIEDPGNTLKLNDKLKLVPGHCDPTVNLYDWYVAVRGGRVEAVWPVTARGRVA